MTISRCRERNPIHRERGAADGLRWWMCHRGVIIPEWCPHGLHSDSSQADQGVTWQSIGHSTWHHISVSSGFVCGSQLLSYKRMFHERTDPQPQCWTRRIVYLGSTTYPSLRTQEMIRFRTPSPQLDPPSGRQELHSDTCQWCVQQLSEHQRASSKDGQVELL